MTGTHGERHLNGNSDKRYFPRWTVSSRVVYHLPDDHEFLEGKTKDISCAGACIVGEKYIPPRQKIGITVFLDEETKIRLNGYIQWITSADGGLEMGVTFYDTPDHTQELILQHAFEIDRKQVVNQWFKGWPKS